MSSQVPQISRLIPFIAIAIVWLAGCATPSHRTALAPTVASDLQQIEALASLNQPEIGADINRSNIAVATGGGLIPALIDLAVDSSRSKKAEGIISPVRDALADFNATELLQTELDAALLAQTALPLKTVMVVPPLSTKALKERAEAVAADAVLMIAIDHRFSPDFGRIDAQASVTLLPLTPELKKQADAASTKYNQPLYQNVLLTGRSLSGAQAKDKAANVSRWAANQGAAARTAIASCFAELAAMIAFDLTQDADAGRPPKEQWDQSAPAPLGPGAVGRILMRGKAVHTTQDRIWVRISTGELSSNSQ